MWLSHGGENRELRDGQVVVGSGADADWRIGTADLRPKHFLLNIHGLNASLRAATRDAVVVVNGKQVAASHLLNDGDVISAGSGQFIFGEQAPRSLDSHAADTGAAFLVAEEGHVAHELVSRSTTLGRDESNAIVIGDPHASRFHAEIRREGGGFALHSMGSTGTMVNGRTLSAPCLLQEGDVIEIAYGRLRFTRSAPSAETVPAGAQPRSTNRGRRTPTLITGKLPVVDSRPDSGGPMVVLVILVAIAGGVLYLVLR